MKALIIVLALIMATAAWAALPVFESITVANTAIGFTAAIIGSTTDIVTEVDCTLETAQIRFRVDGTDPTSTEGHILNVGSSIKLTNRAEIAKFKAIRTGAASGALKCSYK